MEKYYKLLDLQTTATEQEVKQAYRDLVKVWHPDRFMHDINLQRRAEDKLKEINDAYQRIVDHLNNSRKQQQSQQSQRTEKQEKTQPPPKRAGSWICPECLRTNYLDNLLCGCGFRTNDIDVKTYNTNISAAELFDAILFNRSMSATERADFLSRYLLIRFPNSEEADLIKQGAQSSTPSRQKKKPIKFRHLRKYWGWYLVSSLFIFGLISNAIDPKHTSHKTTRSNSLPPKSTQTFSEPIQKLPSVSFAIQSTQNKYVAPLKIAVPNGSNHYFVKVADWHTDKLVCEAFIRAGDAFSFKVPLGSFKIKYATGEQWYGFKFLFGPNTSYNMADERFDFEVKGKQVSGYTVELFLQPHGNLRTKNISPEEF